MGVKYKVIDITESPKILEKYQIMVAPELLSMASWNFGAFLARRI